MIAQGARPPAKIGKQVTTPATSHRDSDLIAT